MWTPVFGGDIKHFRLSWRSVRAKPGSCQIFSPDALSLSMLPVARNVYGASTTLEKRHVDDIGEMPLSDRPFHLLGIGNGANIASAFTCGPVHKKWKPTLRSLTCINGFAAVDTQLAAVLHSAQRAFQCFPPSRPDLPITFWSR